MKADQNYPPKTSGLKESQMAAIIEQAHWLATEGTKGDKIEVIMGGAGKLYINRFARVRPEPLNSGH